MNAELLQLLLRARRFGVWRSSACAGGGARAGRADGRRRNEQLLRERGALAQLGGRGAREDGLQRNERHGGGGGGLRGRLRGGQVFGGGRATEGERGGQRGGDGGQRGAGGHVDEARGLATGARDDHVLRQRARDAAERGHREARLLGGHGQKVLVRLLQSVLRGAAGAQREHGEREADTCAGGRAQARLERLGALVGRLVERRLRQRGHRGRARGSRARRLRHHHLLQARVLALQVLARHRVRLAAARHHSGLRTPRARLGTRLAPH